MTLSLRNALRASKPHHRRGRKAFRLLVNGVVLIVERRNHRYLAYTYKSYGTSFFQRYYWERHGKPMNDLWHDEAPILAELELIFLFTRLIAVNDGWAPGGRAEADQVVVYEPKEIPSPKYVRYHEIGRRP